jgi:hypothetical protein
MLGETLGEERGKLTGTRVLSVDARGAKMEASFEATGRILGVEVVDRGTYCSVPWPGGVLHGEGQGVMMTKDGEMATWSGRGIGRFTGPGKISWRGAIYFQTSSERLARLNGIVGVFEYDTDAEGAVSAKTYEWK